MVLSWEKISKFIRDLDLEDLQSQKEKEDIVEWVKEEVPKNQECQIKFYGLDVKEF